MSSKGRSHPASVRSELRGGDPGAVPAAREALRLEREGGAYRVVDDETGQRVGVDALGAAVLAELDRPRAPTALVAAMSQRFQRSVPPEHVLRRVQVLARTYLLQGPRAARFVALAKRASPNTAVASGRAERPLAFSPELRHACQACGGCCVAADVGPLPRETVDRILARRWADEIPALARGERPSPFRREMLGSEEIWLTEVVDGACIFLREDKLCRVHAEQGEDAKPTICKQFPYHFTALPDGSIAVSIQMECRAWLRAKRAAPPTESRQGDLRELLRHGAFVQEVAEPLELAPGVAVEWAEAREIEGQLDQIWQDGAVREAPERVAAHVFGVVRGFEAAFAPSERYLEPARWGLGDQTGERTDGADATALVEGLHGVLARAEAEFDARGDTVRVAMHRTFGEMVREAVGRDVRAERFRQPTGALDEVLADAWRAALMARDAWFQRDLAAGLGQLVFRHRLIEAGAALRADKAVRAEILDQDAVDSMVVANKMLRQWSVSAFLRSKADVLRRIFIERGPQELA